MARNKVSIYKNPQRTQCDSWTCTNRAAYFIGNPDERIYKPTYCEECIKQMLTDLPTELVEVAESNGQESHAVNTSEAQEQAQQEQAKAEARASIIVPEESERTVAPQDEPDPSETAETDANEQDNAQEKRPPQEKLRAQLKGQTVKELQAIAKEKEIKKYYEMDKAELVNALVNEGDSQDDTGTE